MSVNLRGNRSRVTNGPLREHSRTVRGLRIRVPTGLIGLAFAALVLSACGSSGATAAQQVCDDRSQLNTAVTTVVNDLRSGNFSKAKSDLPAVTDSFDTLRASVENLSAEQSQSLKPQIDKLKHTVSSLRGSSSFNDLVNSIDSVWNQAKSISQQIGDSLKCS